MKWGDPWINPSLIVLGCEKTYYPFVWFRGSPLAVWQRHLGERDTNESMANYVIGHYSLKFWHPLRIKIVDPNLFKRSGANIRRQSCVPHGHAEFCWFCSIPSTTLLLKQVAFSPSGDRSFLSVWGGITQSTPMESISRWLHACGIRAGSPFPSDKSLVGVGVTNCD